MKLSEGKIVGTNDVLLIALRRAIVLKIHYSFDDFRATKIVSASQNCISLEWITRFDLRIYGTDATSRICIANNQKTRKNGQVYTNTHNICAL